MPDNLLASLNNPALNTSIGGSGTSGVQVFGNLLRGLINIAFIAGVVVFVAMLIWGGIQYVTSGGDKEVVQKSTKRLSTALVGLLILFSVYVILGLISAFTGLNLVNITIPTFSQPGPTEVNI